MKREAPGIPPAEEIARRMDGLGLWEALSRYNWAVKPKGTAFPYFCSVLMQNAPPVKVRFLMLEGWQTFHDYVRTRADNNFGFYSTPMEFPHFEAVVAQNGSVGLFRHDPGYIPAPIPEGQAGLCASIMWEAFGVMMRIEADSTLPMKFSGERALFARVERSEGKWEDAPLEIPDPAPHVEKIMFRKDSLAKAKDLPFAAGESVEVEFRMLLRSMTNEPRPRSVYALVMVDGASGECFSRSTTSVERDGGLRMMWESVPQKVLDGLIARGRMPGEVKVTSGRVFRLLRPLCIDIPFRLSLHDSLPNVEKTFAAGGGTAG